MQIPDLTLPRSGGVVKFRNDDDLTGTQYRALRSVWNAAGDTTNETLAHAAALLIAGWDIPSLPGLPPPSFDKDGSVDVGAYAGLKWQDVRAIDGVLMPFLREAFQGIDRPRDVPLIAPSGDSD